MFPRNATTPPAHQRGPDADAPGVKCPARAGDAHLVALIRRPSVRGRIALILGIALIVGPGGTWLFRLTQHAMGADHGEHAGSEGDLPGWKSAPGSTSSDDRWDLTEQARNAWMLVERPTADSSVQTVSSNSAESPTSELPVIDLSSSHISSQTSSVQPTTYTLFDATEPAPLPQSAEIEDASDQWQGIQDPYIVTPEASPVAPPDSNFAAETNAPAAEAPAEAAPAVETPVAETPDAGTPAAESPAEPGPATLNADAQPLIEFSPNAVFTTPATAPCATPICGVHCNGEAACGDLRWKDAWMIPWEVFAQGEYIGPARTPHVPEYRLRVDDQIEFVYRLTGEKSAEPYRISTGDTLRIESLTSENLNRDALVQPDGTISMTQLGQVMVAGRTIDEVRQDLEERYKILVRDPAITVTPIKLNTVLEELRSTVDNRFGSGGQSRLATVTPEGTVQLPAIGSVPAHGLTLAELGAEIRFRYAEVVNGLEVTPILYQRAPRYIYVVGEVRAPGRYTLEGPTTLMQAVALAGGWNVGANLTEVVVFRRDDCWRLMATRVGLRRPLYGKDPCPDGEMWLRDSDIVVVPKSPILVVDEFIDLVFTRGIYGVIPFNTSLSYVRNLTGAGTTVIPGP